VTSGDALSWSAALERLAGLALLVEAVDVQHLERPSAGGGPRRTAVARLTGGGVEGLGEEVTFQHDDLLRALPDHGQPFHGASTLAELWERLDDVDLFDREPRYDVVRSYRRWALEAAALDLALRQAGLSLGDAVGRVPAPVRFVVSPPRAHLRRFGRARLKVDAVDLQPGLPVEIVDFKGAGDARSVEQAVALYPEALLEDPPHVPNGARVSWDIGIRSRADLDRLLEPPAAINVKPARLGSLPTLFELYDVCASTGIAVYGGGQHELGPGREQIQLLAALFHPDAPNDVAPEGYNEAQPPARLPVSPLSVPSRPGFGWRARARSRRPGPSTMRRG
jgi:hypothetical protein